MLVVPSDRALAIDIGGTKTSWAIVDQAGKIEKQDIFPTPEDRDALLKQLIRIIADTSPQAIGIGIAGTISANHRDIVVSPNLPNLSHFEIVATLQEAHDLPIALDNDARCALIGEAWTGAATEVSSAVLLTLGTGVGGAVMQKNTVLPHPFDLTKEIAYLKADSSDIFPCRTGAGSVEALLGGKNLEMRYGCELGKVFADARKKNPEAQEIVNLISHSFKLVIETIWETYEPKLILIGGKGALDLDLYLDYTPPTKVVAAKNGEAAGLIGAARLGYDILEKTLQERAEWDSLAPKE